MTINWITIRVKNFEKSKSFYSEYLGLKFEREFSPNPNIKIAFFSSENGVKIELIFSEDMISTNTGVSIGISSPEYAQLLEKARFQNIITSEPAILGGHVECFFVTDPNGVGIQIIKN